MSMQKGEHGSQCNRTVCESFPATYYNHSTGKYYCGNCAFDIQDFENAQPNPAVIFEEFWKEKSQ